MELLYNSTLSSRGDKSNIADKHNDQRRDGTAKNKECEIVVAQVMIILTEKHKQNIQ